MSTDTVMTAAMEEPNHAATEESNPAATEERNPDVTEEANPAGTPEAAPGRNDMAALEAILFAMGDPVETDRLADAIGRTAGETRELLQALRVRHQEEDSGIQVLCLEDTWQLSTKKEYYEPLIKIARQPKKPNLTEVMMETLSIIAYKQPVTRSEIEKIRGVSCEHAVNRLMEYGLICELGRLQVPGRPILLGTTDRFLRCFGMESTEELPVLSQVELEDFKAEAEAELQVQVDV